MPDVDFETTVRVRHMKDHVPGNFEWAVPPTCCDRLIRAFDEKAVFVSNFVDQAEGEDPYNHVYIDPLTADGDLLSDKGIGIQYCPFCGTKLRVRKKY